MKGVVFQSSVFACFLFFFSFVCICVGDHTGALSTLTELAQLLSEEGTAAVCVRVCTSVCVCPCVRACVRVCVCVPHVCMCVWESLRCQCGTSCMFTLHFILAGIGERLLARV